MEFQLIGEGNTRVVYLLPSKKHVLKLPKDEEGTYDNFREDFRYKQWKSIELARCRVIKDTNYLIMEYVQPAEFRGGFKEIKTNDGWIGCPGWVLSIDCCQVGWNLAGKLVAYDYA
jgi:hypothetical protein